jgi:hypothetical protein
VVLFLFHGRPVHFSSTDDGRPRGSDFSAADSPSSSTRFDSSPPSSSLPLPLPLPFLFHRAVGPSASLPLPARRSDNSSAATGRRIVPARRPDDASPSAAAGVGRRQRGGAASSRYAFLTLKSYVPQPFLDMFRDVPVPRFGTKFLEHGMRRRSAFPVTKGRLAHHAPGLSACYADQFSREVVIEF